MIKTCDEARIENISTQKFCNSVGVSERSFYLWRSRINDVEAKKRGRKTPPKNKLSPQERSQVVDLLLKKEWSDYSPRELYYKLLDEEGKIIASASTLYRVAKKDSLLMKRSKTTSKKPLNRQTPHLVATGPNQIWSWDVTQIRSDIRSSRFYLYVILDIWSRLSVGWIIEDHEKTELAISMWKETLERQQITGKGLTNHKDNGSMMTSKEMIKFVKDMDMIDSYSRAGVSDDNPFSESLFGTIKTFRVHRPTSPHFQQLEILLD